MKKVTLLRLSAIPAVMLATASAQAAAIDVGAVVTDIGAQATPVGLIGGAVLLLFVGIKAFQWVRKALS